MPDPRDRPADLVALSPALTRMLPAPVSRRVLARVTDVLLLGVVGGLLTFVRRTLPDVSDPRSVMTAAIGVQVVAVLVWVTVLVVLARTGRLPGDRIWGLRQVRVGNAGPPGWAGVFKYLLLWVLSLVTLGIGYLVTAGLATRSRFGRSWLDRVFSLVVADVRLGRDPVVEHAEPVLVHAVPIAAVVADLRAENPDILEMTMRAQPAPADRTALDPWTRVNPQVGGGLAPVRILMPGGTAVEVSGPTAFGRNPSPPPDRPTTALAVVSDPGKSVSKTHAVLTPQAGGLLVEDLHSTNGTSVITTAGQEVPVTPGERVSVQWGWQIVMGAVPLVVEPR